MKKNYDCSTPRLMKPLNDVNSSFRQNSQSKYEQQKYQQLINHITVRFPSIKEKVSHYIYLLNLFDDIRIDTLTNQFIKILQSCMKNFDQQHKRITELEEEFEKYKEEKEGKLKEYSKIIVEKDLTKQKKMQVQEKNMLVLKHVQLQKTIDILSNNLKNVQEKDQILKPLLKKQIVDQTSIIQDQQILQTESEQIIEDLKQQLIFAKRQDKMSSEIIKELQLKVQIYEEQINQQQKTITELQEQKSKYYELFYMCNEDFHSYKIQISQKQNQIKIFEGIIKVLQNRIDKLTVKRSKEIQPPFSSRMDYEEYQLASITRPLESEQTFHKYMSSTTMDENNKKQQVNDQIHDISKIRFNYPPFSNFLDKSTLDILAYQFESQKMSINFMGTLRAIMDGMYQEIQKEQFISFQSYVYSWLSTFHLENHEIKLIPYDLHQQIQEFIDRFYLQLMIPKFDKVWEIIQFRHFLNEVYTNEELCFYLHVRYLLKGVWIEQFDFMHELVNYIKIEKAEQIIALVLSKLNKTNIIMIFKSLRQSSIQVNKNLLVQTGYVLQMMLEIYRVDRNQRYKQLQQLFPSSPVGFKKFFYFVLANFQLSPGEIVELYRETYLVSKGKIGVNSFFVVSQKLRIDQIKGLNFLEKDFNQSDLISELKLIHGDNYMLLEELIKKTYQEKLINNKDIISYIKHYQLEKSKDRLILLINQIIIEEVEQFKLQKLNKAEQNQAITKIQNYFKQKFLKNYLTLYSIINLKLKQLLPAS